MLYSQCRTHLAPRPSAVITLIVGLAIGIWRPMESSASAQPAPPPQSPLPADPAKTLESLMAAGQWAQAEQLIRQLLELKPGEHTLHYNLACVLAHEGRADEASAALKAAIENGFDDVRQLRRDPDLASIRDRDDVTKLIARWPEILELRRATNEAAFPKLFKDRYQRTADALHRFVYFSAFEPPITGGAQDELARLSTWAENTLFSGIFAPDQASLDPWVIVVLPRRDDFKLWSLATFGPAAFAGFSTIGGQYMHDTKQLVAQDLGATLRHEFLHALHWRHMDHLGQKHAFWIQEGLGCLVEDLDVAADGTLSPSPSWRTNTAKRRDRANILMPLEKLCAITREQFVHQAQVMGNYAQARTFFIYLHQRGLLTRWYQHYVTHFDADPTGAMTTREVLGGTWDEINRAYRLWVRTLPDVAEEIAEGKASLGVRAESGEGDGVRITETPTKAQFPPEIAPIARLRRDDVVLSIDGRPTRDLAELVRVLDGREIGEVVAIEFRRGREMLTSKLALIAKPKPDPRSLLGR